MMRLHVRNIDGRENIGAVFELQWGNIFDTIYPYFLDESA